MSLAPADPSPRSVVELLTETETTLDAQIRGLKKTKTVLGGGRRKLEKEPSSQKILEKLVSDLQKLPSDVSTVVSAVLSKVVPALQQRLQELSSNLERDLRNELQQQAAGKGLDFGLAAGTLFLGPFALSLDLPRERARLAYATLVVADRIPLDAVKIIAECELHSQAILAPVDQLDRMAEELEQALQVAILRTRKSQTGSELRAELPAVYREMVYIRQSLTRPLTRASVREYSLARFLVELKTLIQSDRNLSANSRFRLETAVLDNTRNQKKSVYIPNDLNKGYGEGMYFQALVQLVQN